MLYLVDFGPSYPGLATVGYLEMKIDATTAVARTTTGVVDFGNGAYGVSVTLNAATTTIKWDTGDASPVYAHDNVVPQPVTLVANQHVIVDSGTVTTVSGNVGGSVGSVTGTVDANVKQINSVTLAGNGNTQPMGPA
jgi:hypothetical protein